MLRNCLIAALTLLFPGAVSAQVDARMFRQPAVSADKIAFVYAGDIWLVPKAGGAAIAAQLAARRGDRSRASRPTAPSSPYSADYDGNTDVYVVPTAGGEPVRLTHHPMADRVVGWHPDGKRVLFASGRESGRQRYNQFYLVGLDGGLPEKLPVPYGEFGAFSPDGARFVYMPMAQDFRNWKRYRGGWAPDLWLFDLKTLRRRATSRSNPANDAQPMWRGNTVYFLSDRGAEQRNNIWAEDMGTGAVRQVTQFDDFDITFPSIGPDAIVFQKGGRLYLLSLPGEKVTEVPDSRRDRRDDAAAAHDKGRQGDRTPRRSRRPAGASRSKRAATSSRAGRARRGDQRDAQLRRRRSVSALVARRQDARLLERSQRRVRADAAPADGTGAERKVTSLGPGFRYPPQWSPDSKKLAFIDQAMRIRVYDDATGKVTDVDKSPDWIAHDGLEAFRFQWSPDSRWIAYARPAGTSNNAIFLFDTKNGTLQQATQRLPERHAADLRSRRQVPVLRVRPRVRSGLRHVRQHLDLRQPDAARRRAAAEGRQVAARRAQRRREPGARHRQEAGRQDQKDDKTADDKPAAPANVDIDLDRFEARAVVLPPKVGHLRRSRRR